MRPTVRTFHALLCSIKSAPEALAFVAFDPMLLDGEDLRSRPPSERRHLLEKPVNSIPSQAIEQLGLEGIVSKREGSLYGSGD